MAFLFLASACSGGGDGQATASWVEPGWMAQARQELEEYQGATLSCLAEHGTEGEVMIGGAVAGVPQTAADGAVPPGAQELVDEALVICSEQVPIPSLWTTPADEAAYERVLDVRQCIIAQGYDVEEPPSSETWIEDVSDDGLGWGPYDRLSPNPEGTGLPYDELAALMEECPQSGHGMTFASSGE